MASKSKIIDGAETIVFTSRSRNPVITLKAEQGKTLQIEGEASGTGSLFSRKPTTALGYFDLSSSSTDLSGTEVDNQGVKIALSDNNYCLVTGQSAGPVANVWKYTAGTWIEEAVLETPVVTIAVMPQNCCINEDGSFVAITYLFAVTVQDTRFYRRDGSTWTGLSYASNSDFKCSGKRLLHSFRNFFGDSALYVYNTDDIGIGPLPSPEHTFWSANQYISIFDISNDGSLVVYGPRAPYDTCVSVNNRSGTTWTETAKLYLRNTDTDFKALACKNDVIILVTNISVYVWQNTGANWFLSKVIDAPDDQISKAIITLNEDGDVNRFCLYSASKAYLYARDLSDIDSTSGFFDFNFVTEKTLTNDSDVGMNSTFFITGKTTQNKATVQTLTSYLPITNQTIHSIEVDEELTLDSNYRLIVNGDMHLTGDLLVAGLINGATVASYAWYTGARYHSVSNDTLTSLTQFDACQGSTMIPLATPNGTFTTSHPGIYSVHATVTFAANSTGYREVSVITSSNSDTGILQRLGSLSSVETVVQASGQVNCQAGEVITLKARQTSGGSLSCALLKFSLVYLGP